VGDSLLPYAAVGALVYVLTLADLRLGLGLTMLCIALSPELPPEVGIANLRLEDLLLPGVVLSWLVRMARERQAFEPTPLQVPILLYLLLAAVSALHAVSLGGADAVRSVFFYGKVAEYFVFYLVFLNNVRTPEEARAFGVCALVAAGVLGVWGIHDFLVGGEAFAYGKMSGPPGETSNVLGGYFVFHLCLAIGVLVEMEGTGKRLVLVGYLLLLFVPFLLTLSRTSYAALFGALVTVGLLRRRSLLLWMFAAVMVLPYFVSESVLARAATIFDIFGDSPPSSWSARVYAWDIFGRRALAHPLLGLGVGTVSPGRVDNGYLHMLVETGIPGTIAFLWFLGATLLLAHRAHVGHAGQPFLRGLALGFLCGTVGLMLHAFGAPTFTAIRTMEPFMVLLGVVTVLANRAGEWGGEGRAAAGAEARASDLMIVTTDAAKSPTPSPKPQ